jgi:hypothetical protein
MANILKQQEEYEQKAGVYQKLTIISESDHGDEAQARDIQKLVSAISPDALARELDPQTTDIDAFYSALSKITWTNDYCDAFLRTKDQFDSGDEISSLSRKFRDSTRPIYTLDEKEVSELWRLTEHHHKPEHEMGEEANVARQNLMRVTRARNGGGRSTKEMRLAHTCRVHDTTPYAVDEGKTEMLKRATQEYDAAPNDYRELRDMMGQFISSSESKFNQLLSEYPFIGEMLDEGNQIRDRYMAQNIDQICNEEGHNEVVAVMGRSHFEGVRQRLDTDYDITCLSRHKSDDPQWYAAQ